jgi:predicted N-acetyltransferase YhbS
MTEADVPAVMDVAARAFDFDLEAAERERPGARDRWRRRISHLLETDPEGAFVADTNGTVVGVSQAMIREGLWVLSLLTVDPARQSDGAGRALMRAALEYGPASAPGLIVSSNDPRALRLYARSGFRLLPALHASGTVRTDLQWPADPDVIEVGPDGITDLEPLAREVRGAPWTAELPYAMTLGAKLFRLGDRGFTVATRDHGVWMLAARDEQAAQALLWRAIEYAAGSGQARVRWLTADQQWGIDVVLEAGLSIQADGAICARGNPGTLAPFIPTAPFA